MDPIAISVLAFKVSMAPKLVDGKPAPVPPGASPTDRLKDLDDGKAMPSTWDDAEITDAFKVANDVWAKASIKFDPVAISARTDTVPADGNELWIYFVNNLPPMPPRKGIAIGFVADLPSDEGGWGGGRVCVLSKKKTDGALAGFAGRLLAHELGHVLFNSMDHEASASNLMFAKRHPRVVSADLLEGWQVDKARERAKALS